MVQIGAKKVAAGPKKSKKALTFTIDCSKPVEDKVGPWGWAPCRGELAGPAPHLTAAAARLRWHPFQQHHGRSATTVGEQPPAAAEPAGWLMPLQP